MKYRHGTEIVEAYQWKGWGMGGYHPEIEPTSTHSSTLGWIRAGNHIVTPNDWIVTGKYGEKYPVSPDIFKSNYVEVNW